MRIVLLWAACLFAVPAWASAASTRIFEFNYEILPTSFPGGKAVDIYIPLPTEGKSQRILLETLQTSLQRTMGTDTAYGNRYLHLHRPAQSNEQVSASLSWIVAREKAGDDEGIEEGVEEGVEARQQFLAANTLVPVNHEVLEPILAEIHQMRENDSADATAKAIYDWVVDNVEYKKVGTGWGNGDTFWACSERYGNCTDFHALFVSLARSEGIPARFEIGFPVPLDREAGDIGGYHCWVQFYLPGRGWVPIDASEAAKHPEQRESLYGSHPADRIHFTTGRDIVVPPGSVETPLNYFIYPYVEVGGKAWAGKVRTRFSFETATAP